MRRMTLLVTALALVLGLAQCKKEQMPTNNPTEGISITLDVNDGDNGNSKVIVNPTGNPNFATVSFETGDTIYVGNGGQYRGFLIYDGSKFVGTISGTDFNDEDYLHFYFLGGLGFKPTIDGNTATVSISNQTEKYPVISYAHSTDLFTMDNKNYRAKLQNKVSIMKFNVDTPSSSAICITGMNNKVSVDFSTPNGDDNGFSYSRTNGGLITMHSKDAEGATWAIVLPQGELTTTGDAYSEDHNYTGTRPTIHAIEANKYYHEGDDVINMAVNTLNPDGPLATPLTLEALTDGTIVVSDPRSGMQYSLNGGAKSTMSGTTTIDVVAGNKVQFYGNGTSISSYYNYSDGTQITGGTAQVKVYGNIMSLIDETGYATLTTLPNLFCSFAKLFFMNTNIKDASGLMLPATTLAFACYSMMFKDCTSLTKAPALPATTLAEYCYERMFEGCTSLTKAPELLPATTLEKSCCYRMFWGCTSLVTAPTLPATTLAEKCYNEMFWGCTSLTKAPTLPATTLAEYCYTDMFYGCTSLTKAPALPARTLAKYCYMEMFTNCTSLATAPALPATTLALGCFKQMFWGCTNLTTASALPATTLAESCYVDMFNGCTNLTTAPALPARTLAFGCYYNMFADCTSLTAAPSLPATTLTEACYAGMFSGCTSLTNAPALPATTLAEYCYQRMFSNCTSLTVAPLLPAPTLTNRCYDQMFFRCTNLSSITCLATAGINENYSTSAWLSYVAATGTFTKASSATSWPTGSNGIPSRWTVNEQ